MMALPELDTRSVLNVVEENFKKLGPGSEDTIHRHLRFLFEREAKWIAKTEKIDGEENGEQGTEGLTVLLTDETESKPERKMFRRLKNVMTYHSIRTLHFQTWRAVTARPPSLIGTLNIYGPLQEHLEQLRIFLNKINNICIFAKADENLSFEGLRVIDPRMEALPEVALLDFLLQSPHILQLRETASLHRYVDDYLFYYDEVWPLANHFTPRHLYKLKIDDSFVEPLPVMPWEVVTKEGDEEEREEREEPTDGSSTD